MEVEPFGNQFILLPPITAGARKEKLRYEDKGLVFTANQLLGGGWSLGALYAVADVRLDTSFPGVLASSAPGFEQFFQSRSSASLRATLQQARVFALYNDPSGFFARAEALWTAQDNYGYPRGPLVDPSRQIQLVSPMRGADFWMFNVYGGYRLPRNIGDNSVGLLNLTSIDYRLNPLNEYAELPRSFTVSVQTRLNF